MLLPRNQPPIFSLCPDAFSGRVNHHRPLLSRKIFFFFLSFSEPVLVLATGGTWPPLAGGDVAGGIRGASLGGRWLVSVGPRLGALAESTGFPPSFPHSPAASPIFHACGEVAIRLMVSVSKRYREPGRRRRFTSSACSAPAAAAVCGGGTGRGLDICSCRSGFEGKHCVFSCGSSHAEVMKSVCFGKSFVLLWWLAAGQLLAAAALTKHQRILLKSCV